MIALALSLLVSAAAPPATAPAPAPGPVSTTKENDSMIKEVTELLQTQAGAWSRGDLEAFCAVYDDQAAFLAPSGVTTTRQAVFARYKAKYQDKGLMGALKLEVLDARAAPGGGAVSVGMRWTLTYVDKPALTGLSLVVLHKIKGGAWRIVQDASM